MTPVPVTTTLDATCISDGLADVLGDVLVDGLGLPVDFAVRSVHRSALNLVTPDGALITVADERVGGLPSGILVRGMTSGSLDLRSVGVRPGMPGTLTSSRAVVGQDALVVRLTGARRWSPRIARLDPEPWPARSPRAHALSRAISASGGIGSISAAHTALQALGAAIEAAESVRTTAAARRLIGLGPGLTPSGDDVLTGVAAALHAVGHPCAGSLADALDDLDARTTFVAAAMLRHAVRGDVAERTHRLLAALLAPVDVQGVLDAAIHETVAWGATSGSDLLTGVLLALDAATADVATHGAVTAGSVTTGAARAAA
jgi:Protein of unknown function (DUF2877)